jgi:hypothetical protein
VSRKNIKKYIFLHGFGRCLSEGDDDEVIQFPEGRK